MLSQSPNSHSQAIMILPVSTIQWQLRQSAVQIYVSESESESLAIERSCHRVCHDMSFCVMSCTHQQHSRSDTSQSKVHVR